MINQRMSEISRQQDYLIMKNLADNIKNEIVLASSVSDNYLRKFNVPAFIEGEKYNLSVNDDELAISIGSNKNYYTVLPIRIKGNFIDNINPNTTQHCITKNDFDGIRIAKNQATLEVYQDNKITNQINISVNPKFFIIVYLNCLENVLSIRFTVNYPADVLEFEDTTPIVRNIPQYKQFNPFFKNYIVIYPYPEEESKITFGYLGNECTTGSGGFAIIRFKATQASFASIDFDSGLGENNLQVLECTSKNYVATLQDSKIGAKIRIVK